MLECFMSDTSSIKILCEVSGNSFIFLAHEKKNPDSLLQFLYYPTMYSSNIMGGDEAFNAGIILWYMTAAVIGLASQIAHSVLVEG